MNRHTNLLNLFEIKGLDNSDEVIISNAGLINQDVTTLLPIWAEIPSSKRAKSIVENNITKTSSFWGRFGIPACPNHDLYTDDGVCNRVYLPWCLFVGEGMLSYGYRDETADLVTKIMDGINHSLRDAGCFKEYFNADTAEGYGDNDGLRGLAPLGLFLETLGLQIISPGKIKLSGKNPFPWPVTVKFRGMTVLRGPEKPRSYFQMGKQLWLMIQNLVWSH